MGILYIVFLSATKHSHELTQKTLVIQDFPATFGLDTLSDVFSFSVKIRYLSIPLNSS